MITLTLTPDTIRAVPYIGNGRSAVGAACAKIVSGDYVCPGAANIVALDNALILCPDFPINSVLLVGTDRSSAFGYKDAEKAAADAIVAAIIAQYPA